LDLLPDDGLRPFTKEDGEVVIDANGRREVRPPREHHLNGDCRR
jgi:hypothetical protein